VTYTFHWKAEGFWFLVQFIASFGLFYLGSSDADILKDPQAWLGAAFLSSVRVAVAGFIRPLASFVASRKN